MTIVDTFGPPKANNSFDLPIGYLVFTARTLNGDDIFIFTNVNNLPEVRVISLRKEDCLKVFPNRKVTPDQADILFSGETNPDQGVCSGPSAISHWAAKFTFPTASRPVSISILLFKNVFIMPGKLIAP